MPSPTLTDKPIRGASIVAVDVVAAIEEDIVLGRLYPRERLVEDDLMDRFACKRHVIRQALFELERIGLVERIKNRGAFVKAYSPNEVEDLYTVREILETAAAAMIPLPAPGHLIEKLEDIHKRYCEAVLKEDLRLVFRLNISFHETLFSATGNDYLSEAINELAQKAHGIRFTALTDPENLQTAMQEHQEMIDALKRNDREKLRDLCKRHLVPSKDIYLSKCL